MQPGILGVKQLYVRTSAEEGCLKCSTVCTLHRAAVFFDISYAAFRGVPQEYYQNAGRGIPALRRPSLSHSFIFATAGPVPGEG